MNKKETLASPQQLIEALQGRAKEIMQQCYVTINTFGCVLYGTREPWDTGECLGYSIYYPDHLEDELERYLNYINWVGTKLASSPYKGDLRKPGSCMTCRASLIFERKDKANGSTQRFNKAFLESSLKRSVRD